MKRLVACAVIVLAAGLAGCGGSTGRSVTFDVAMDDRIAALASSPEPALLRDATDFDWETVSVFWEGASPEDVVEETGVDVLDSRYIASRALLVFCSEAAVVRVHGYAYPNLSHSSGLRTYSSEVRLVNGGALTDAPENTPATPACASP